MRLRGSPGETLQVARDACGYLSGPVGWATLGSAHYHLAGSSRAAVTAHFGNDSRQACARVCPILGRYVSFMGRRVGRLARLHREN